MLSEKIELLGKGLYKGTGIPDVLTLHSIPTTTELEYVGGEDFNEIMLESVLPQAVEEKINFRQLYEFDFYWVCRCLRILNYGPYYTAPAVFCESCRNTSRGEFEVDLRTVECIPLPKGFKNDIELNSDNFIDFEGKIKIRLLTIQDTLNMRKDKLFQTDRGTNLSLARICYSIKSFNDEGNLSPMDVKLKIQKELSSADYILLRDQIHESTNFGLVASGTCECPACKSPNGSFFALIDDRFFRPTVGDLKQWKLDRTSGRDKENS